MTACDLIDWLLRLCLLLAACLNSKSAALFEGFATDYNFYPFILAWGVPSYQTTFVGYAYVIPFQRAQRIRCNPILYMPNHHQDQRLCRFEQTQSTHWRDGKCGLGLRDSG
ncbi:hypothetical protein F5880DRAFT_863516 [Lentinula raphanica]|nr:hypothetical protein F5880DRAFT_863516 [Lentinula raphanica]